MMTAEKAEKCNNLKRKIQCQNSESYVYTDDKLRHWKFYGMFGRGNGIHSQRSLFRRNHFIFRYTPHCLWCETWLPYAHLTSCLFYFYYLTFVYRSLGEKAVIIPSTEDPLLHKLE